MNKKLIFTTLLAIAILVSVIFSAAWLLRPKEIILPVSITAEEKQKTENSISEILKAAKNCLPRQNFGGASELEKDRCYAMYLQLGINYETLGKITKAISAYNKAAQIMPNSYTPYSNLGSIFRQLKDFARAEEYFKKALAINTNNTVVYAKLYELYFYDLKKPPHLMTPFFSEALKNTGDDPSISRLYAFYSETINDPETALAIWKVILGKEPNNEAVKAKIKQLEEKIKTVKSNSNR